MRNFVYVLFLVLIFGGCSYKNEPLKLNSYKANYKGATAKANSSVYIQVVQDKRADKNVIGSIQENSKDAVVLRSDVDFAKKYKEGLSSALKVAGFKVVNEPKDKSMIMSIYIDSIKLVKKDSSFDENLQGEINVSVEIKQGAKTVKQNFKQKAGKWIKPSYDASDLEEFLYGLFSDNINTIVARLTNY